MVLDLWSGAGAGWGWGVSGPQPTIRCAHNIQFWRASAGRALFRKGEFHTNFVPLAIGGVGSGVGSPGCIAFAVLSLSCEVWLGFDRNFQNESVFELSR